MIQNVLGIALISAAILVFSVGKKLYDSTDDIPEGIYIATVLILLGSIFGAMATSSIVPTFGIYTFLFLCAVELIGKSNKGVK